MQWSDLKIDDNFSERTIIFGSSSELVNFRRIMPDDRDMPPTHVRSIRYVKDPKNSNPAALPVLKIGTRERNLTEIGELTNGFAKLALKELRWLCKRYAVTIPPLKKGEVNQDETVAIVTELRKRVEQTKGEKPAPISAAALIANPDDEKLTDADLEDKAVKFGVLDAYKVERKKGKAQALALLAKVQLEEESKTAAK